MGLTEGRIEFAIGCSILVLRWFVRFKTLGIHWRMDDWFSVSTFVWYVGLFAMVEWLAIVGAPLGFTEEMREALTAEERASLQKGAKGMYGAFYCLICMTWSAKGTLIVFFQRLTRQTKMERYVLGVAWLSVACFVAAVITAFTHCLPIERNWQIVPDPGFECSAGFSTNIVLAVGTVLVDGLLLAVPILTLRDANIKLWRKCAIIFLLSLGLFVMGMALARCILSLDHGPGVAQSSDWANREALVTIFAVNAPVLNALFKRETWRTSRGTTYANTYQSGSHHMPSSGSKSRPNKLEIYRMTDIERSSRESQSNLVSETAVPASLRGDGRAPQQTDAPHVIAIAR